MQTYTIATIFAVACATSVKQDIDIAAGVIFGITKYDHLETLQGCMRDADIFSMELIHAVGLITEKDQRGAIAGYRLVMSAIDQFPGFLATCESTGADLKGLEKFFAEFIHPIDVVKRVTHNVIHGLPGLTKNVLQARANLKQEDYFDFGMEIGQIVVALTEPIPAPVSVEAFLQ